MPPRPRRRTGLRQHSALPVAVERCGCAKHALGAHVPAHGAAVAREPRPTKNICGVFDVGALPDGAPYIIMEKLTGEALRARIDDEGGVPFRDVKEILAQVLAA